MRAKLFMSLFALPFAAVGVFMLGWVGKNGLETWQMQSWQPVQARVIDAGYETHSGDGTTYKAYATYSYAWSGQSFTGSRVALDDTADNIGDYQTDMAARLSSAQRSGAPITIYVNPEAPWESIIDRGVRWGMLGFKLIFGLVFGGVGFGLLYATFRAPQDKDEDDPAFAGKPWLLNDAWQGEALRSDSKGAMIGAWIFAGIWSLISAPLPFVVYREVIQNENYVGLIALAFPLVGVGLLYWALKCTLEWRRLGPAPLTLDPFPGSIGGHVGGTIELNQPYDSQARYQLTLTAINSYMSSSGKDRSRREKAQWQDQLVAHAEPTGTGTRLSFRFDVPEGLAESDAQQDNDNYSLWRLNVHAELAGPDIDRDYEIPVYATAQQSRRLSEHVVRRARSEQNALDDAAVLEAVELSSGIHGKRMLFPMGRHLGFSLGGLLVGGIFGGAGWFLVVKEGAAIFGSVFALVGILVGLLSLYMALNSLEVSQDGTAIRTVRRVLGIPVKRSEMQRSAFERFDKTSSMQSQSGKKTIMYYKIYALDRLGKRMVVGEGFRGDNEANAAMRLLARELGIGDMLA